MDDDGSARFGLRMRLDFSFFFFVDRRSIEIINCEIIVRIINRKEEKFKEN